MYDLFQILLISICSTCVFVDAVHKSFNEVAQSFIREFIECALKFNPDRPGSGQISLSSTKHVFGTFLDNI